jgi:hypothetical protein
MIAVQREPSDLKGTTGSHLNYADVRVRISITAMLMASILEGFKLVEKFTKSRLRFLKAYEALVN